MHNVWIDDAMGEPATVLDLFAPYAEEGYVGYFRAEQDPDPTVFVFRDGGHGPV